MQNERLLERIHRVFESLDLMRFFWFCFLYTVAVSLVIQLVLIPYFFPQLNAGHGLISGTDAITFHRWAAEMASKMQQEGWSAWQFRPRGSGTPVSLTAVLYRYIYASPLVLIPINAAVHALSVVVLFRILESFAKTSLAAKTGSLVYLFSLTPVSWYSQIHRDGFVNLGIFLWVFSGVRAARMVTSALSRKKIVSVFLVTIGGGFFVWLGRPSEIRILLMTTELWCFLFFVVVCFRWIYLSHRSFRQFSMSVIVLLAMVCGLKLFQNSQLDDQIDLNEAHSILNNPLVDVQDNWTSNRHIPASLDRQLFQLAVRRNGYRAHYSPSASYIDNDVKFEKASDIILYVPRALQVAWLAPFPNQWWSQGSTFAGTVMRKVSSIEMIVFYFLYLLVIFGVVDGWFRLDFCTLAFFCVCPILVFSVAVNNVGALCRYRFAFTAIVAGLGMVKFAGYFVRPPGGDCARNYV